MMRKLAHVAALLRTRGLKGSIALMAMVAVLSPTWIAAQTPKLPTPKHIVIVVEENHSFKQIIGNKKEAPYINELAGEGASLEAFFALHHPSQPNYMVLFSGDRHGVKGNGCLEKPLTAPSLGGELIRLKGKEGFKGYAEGLPSAGSTVCTAEPKYARKHVPWTSFEDASAASLPFTDFEKIKDFNDLPLVAMVIPNLDNDMHDGKNKIRTADTWLKEKLERYVEWAKNNDSLLIITWDEGNGKSFLWFNRTTKPPSNRIATIFIGPMVKSNFVSPKQYTHLNLLRTLEDMYGLSPLGASQSATPIMDIWK